MAQLLESNSGFEAHFLSAFFLSGLRAVLRAVLGTGSSSFQLRRAGWCQVLQGCGGEGSGGHCVLLSCCRAREGAQPSSEIRIIYPALPNRPCHCVCVGIAVYPNCSFILSDAVLALCFVPPLCASPSFSPRCGIVTCPCPHRDLGHAAGVSCGH